MLAELLEGYEQKEIEFLVSGFEEGFKIPAEAFEYDTTTGNHASVMNNVEVVDSIVQKEIKLGRVRGPFDYPPLTKFHVSPLGLIPKHEPGSYRLIHNLSFPPDESVNAAIPRELCTVTYETLDDALGWVLYFGKGCLMAKADIEEAYRNIPIHPESQHLLGFTWNGKLYYDCCLPFGLSYSCRLFERFATALQWILINEYKVDGISHLLDDFMHFGPANDDSCRTGISCFMLICRRLNIPVKQSKTVPPTTCAVLHGIEVNTEAIEVRLPCDKLNKAIQAISKIEYREKIRKRELQAVISLLAFLCRVVMPCRTLLRRL